VVTIDRTSPTLLERLRNPGDHAAWTRFDAIYGDLIVAFSRRRGLQATDAEDVRQTVTVKLMGSLRGFDYDRSRGRFRDYLYRVVQSALSDRAADRGVPLHVPGALDTSVEAQAGSRDHGRPDRAALDEVDSIWVQEWEAFHFRRAWGVVQTQFSSSHLDMFNHLLDGLGVRQVAEMFAQSEEAVHKVKQRVRDRLREQIAAQMAEEDGT
jgi:RNA polymerase sigma factor (sigma-70 family)